MTRAISIGTLLAVACAFWAGCGPGQDPDPIVIEEPNKYGLTLQAANGAWSDGSGHVGLALLLTLRDANGQGPAEAWQLEISDEAGALPFSALYEAGTRQAAFWWPDAAVSAGKRYWVTARQGNARELSRSFTATSAPIGIPVPEVAGVSLNWSSVSGAASYRCLVDSAGAVQLDETSTSTGCDIFALPSGSYRATISALSFDPTSLNADDAARPVLPDSFSVSEAAIAFAKDSTGAIASHFRSAGGAIFFGTSQPGLAIWTSLTPAQPAGAPWAVTLTGPGIPQSEPIQFEVTSSSPRSLVWFYDVPVGEGPYTLSARAGELTLISTFHAGTPEDLVPPALESVDPRGSGPWVEWTGVPNAKSYFVSAWDRESGAFAGGRWTTSTEDTIPGDEMVKGRTYDVYVTAASIDMTADEDIQSVTLAEDAYQPISFVAP